MQKGFTIIELIVVIAIISVLAAITLANLTAVRQKGKDAAIKNQMEQFYVPATDYYQLQGGYGGIFTRQDQQNPEAAKFAQIVQNIYNKLPAFLDCKTCDNKANGTGWAACAVLNYPIDQSRAWCVDSSGLKTEICANQCTNSGLASGACPDIQPPCSRPAGKDSCSGCAE